jgi:hypothetical protein
MFNYAQCANSWCGCDYDVVESPNQSLAAYDECIVSLSSKCSDVALSKNCIRRNQENCLNQQQKNIKSLSKKLPCSSINLSEAECTDLYKVALMSGRVDEKILSKSLHGIHKESMKRLVSLQSYSYDSPPASTSTTYEMTTPAMSSYDNNSSNYYQPTYNYTEGYQEASTNTTSQDDCISLDDVEKGLRWAMSKKIIVNETLLNQFYQDLEQLQAEYETFKEQAAIEAIGTIQNKYAEYLAKVYVNYGKTVYPHVKSLADFLKAISVSKDCDQDCLYEEFYKPYRLGSF